MRAKMTKCDQIFVILDLAIFFVSNSMRVAVREVPKPSRMLVYTYVCGKLTDNLKGNANED